MTSPGTLYVVATPIGNLGDLSPRAREVLANVQAILAEDTRRTGQLLAACGLATPLLAFFEHNEQELLPKLLARLRRGESLALVADAGTPLLCDPGFRLVRACRKEGLPVAAVPGPSAVAAALSVAGLPPYPFTFLGFLPQRQKARRDFLARYASLPHTLVMFLTPHRLPQELADCAAVLGESREAALCAELSKLFERCLWGTLGSLAQASLVRKGEFTLVVGPPPAFPAEKPSPAQAKALVENLLVSGLPLPEARKQAARRLGVRSKELYQLLEAAKSEA